MRGGGDGGVKILDEGTVVGVLVKRTRRRNDEKANNGLGLEERGGRCTMKEDCAG